MRFTLVWVEPDELAVLVLESEENVFTPEWISENKARLVEKEGRFGPNRSLEPISEAALPSGKSKAGDRAVTPSTINLV